MNDPSGPPLLVLAHPRFLLLIVILTLFSLLVSEVSAGQLFTNGLSIIDSPATGSPGHAGSPLPIAIDVSGNGQLSSATNAAIDLLEIYLVSSQTNINLTVSSGPTLLNNETGSVRHINWPVPTCVPAGNYNLTFYETFEFNNERHFTITPISIPVQNPNPSGTCVDGVNALQNQPQPDTHLAQSPFSPGSTLLSTSPTQTATVTPTFVTITISDGGFDFPTVTRTVTEAAKETTVVMVSMETLTTTVTGQQGEIVTSTLTQTLTTTMVIPQTDTGGFIPVNGGIGLSRPTLIPWFIVGCIIALYR
ncbi:hypothetical protein C8J56DRAFT_919416 [Mycena floridula]|nr:hypothetical protein C8J56DRAFT_919416 [Mycena floridula]